MNTTLAHTADNDEVGTSADNLTIVDNDETEPGTFLTAWRKSGDDWVITVDYFDHVGQWAVYGQMGDDTSPLTTSKMTAVLAAHEDAQGIADHLNASHAITPLLQARKRQQDAFGDALLAALNRKAN